MEDQMKKYSFELILGAILVAVFLATSAFQSTSKLTKAEVDRFMAVLEKAVPVEWEERNEFLVRLRAWGESDDGEPVYMLNVMRFFDQIKPMPGVPANMKPSEANALYEEAATSLLLKSGAYPLVGGDSMRIASGQKKSNLIVHEPELDNWDRVLVVRYPGRRTFFDLVTNPAYLKVMPYKLGSLKVVLTPVKGDLVIPDMRWPIGGACLTIFLLAGWIRAGMRRT
jgi:uncharacterized protein (DUF1330 family)